MADHHHATAQQDPLAMWRAAHELARSINAGPADVTDGQTADLYELETQVLEAPISCRDDALAVMLIAGIGIERGARTDGADERAYARVVKWMEAHGAETAPATEEELARLFDEQDMPIWGDPDLLPSNDGWLEHIVTLRIMWAVLQQSKPRLLESTRNLWRVPHDGGACIEDLLERIKAGRGALEAGLAMINAAESRLLAASSKLALAGELDA
jgi:hypothetical protein